MRRIALLLVLGGCAPEPPTYYVNVLGRGGQVSFDADHYQCKRENTTTKYARYGGYADTWQSTDDDMVMSCLTALGWRRTKG